MAGASRAGMSGTWPNSYMQGQLRHWRMLRSGRIQSRERLDRTRTHSTAESCGTVTLRFGTILSTEPEQAYYHTSSADLPPGLSWRRDLHDFVRTRRYFAAFVTLEIRGVLALSSCFLPNFAIPPGVSVERYNCNGSGAK